MVINIYLYNNNNLILRLSQNTYMRPHIYRDKGLSYDKDLRFKLMKLIMVF